MRRIGEVSKPRTARRIVWQWKATILLTVVLMVASGAYLIYRRNVVSANGANGDVVSGTVCDVFDARQIEKVSGSPVIADNFGRSSSIEYNPDFSCQLSLKGFGDVKIGYINAHWFRDGPSSRVSEKDLLELKSYGWVIKKVDFGLDGKSYFALSPRRESVVAYGAWYSSSGRTFSVALYNLSDTSIGDEKIEEVLGPLTRYLASSTAARFPVATGAGISTPS